MEYEILNRMIQELEQQSWSIKNINEDSGWEDFIHLLTQVKALKTLRMRIDKAREADIIAMSNEGCV